MEKGVTSMRLRIAPEMDFYLDMELQGSTERTKDYDIQHYKKIVYEEFVKRLTIAFPEGDFRIYNFEFNMARESRPQAA
jgi:hypothetical protein